VCSFPHDTHTHTHTALAVGYGTVGSFGDCDAALIAFSARGMWSAREVKVLLTLVFHMMDSYSWSRAVWNQPDGKAVLMCVECSQADSTIASGAALLWTIATESLRNVVGFSGVFLLSWLTAGSGKDRSGLMKHTLICGLENVWVF